MNRPAIAIPLGDPAGIGPEIVVKALAQSPIYETCKPLVVGSISVLEHALRFCNLSLSIHPVGTAEEGQYRAGVIDVFPMDNVEMDKLRIGEIQAMAGQAAFDYIKKSVDLALEEEVDAIATTPINKESLKAAHIDYIGHTEILAGLTDTRDPLTMFQVRNLRVFFLTRHVALREACDLVTKERVLDYILRCSKALEKLGVREGTMAVAGLNPHSGERGLFGDEEVEHIGPAVKEAQALGCKVVGPISADSVFHLAVQGKYNSVLSLYHDQGHIATKTLDFERTISITLGLPFLRTSVDHGTALDIAGKGIAGETSMVEAIMVAAQYAKSYSSQ